MSSTAKSGKKSSISRILVLLVSAGVLVLCWRLGLKWVAGAVVLVLAFYLFVLPKLIVARVEKFNRKAMGLLTSGKHEELLKMAKKDVLLQLFGPKGAIDSRVALAHAAQGEFAKSIPFFEQSIHSVSKNESIPLRIGLTKSLFVIGDFARARKEGTEVLNQGTRLPELLAVVARSKVGMGETSDSVRELIEEAERLSPSDDVAVMLELTRIEFALRSGRKPGTLRDSIDSKSRFIRAWIASVRGQLRQRRSDFKAATESFKKAVKSEPFSFAAADARQKLEAMDSDSGDRRVENHQMDSAVRRKKRRKR